MVPPPIKSILYLWFLIGSAYLSSSFISPSWSTLSSKSHSDLTRVRSCGVDDEEPTASADTSSNCNNNDNALGLRRHVLLGLLGSASSLLLAGPQQALAAFGGKSAKPSSLYVVGPRTESTLQQREAVTIENNFLSSEVCLLKLLPIKNPVFRQLESSIEAISVIRSSADHPNAWKEATQSIEGAIVELDNKRNQLEPVFNPDENSMMQISKAERSEQLVEALRERLVELAAATKLRNETAVSIKEKDTLLALSKVGELLVPSFPYDIPTEGKFSYLPRLLGRARVTFAWKRMNKVLGNVTIVADGYTAPITAGNFVDLSLRQFYTGLPIKLSRKKLGVGSEFEVASLPILGSFQEGFYDPLTAKPRRIPLEIIRNEKGSGVPNLSYSQGLSSLKSSKTKATLEPTENSKPILSFRIPGLVAMNHPDRSPNGGSSEFFSLQKDSLPEEKRGLLDGEYAPFGYIVDGYDLFQSLKPGDFIDQTTVDEWGQLNLVKLRESSLSEVIEGTGKEPETS